MTNVKKDLVFEVDIEVRQVKLPKIKSLKSIRGVIERNHKSRDKIELYHNDIVLVKLIFFIIFA
jgi:hypothetical protein